MYFRNIEDIEILYYLAGEKEDYELHKKLNEKRLKFFPYKKAIYENYWKVVNEYFNKDKK